jgi:HEAT repeat protein
LTAKEFGYAFGLFVHIRGERKPHGARYLRPDAKAMLKTTLHYLRGTADSLFLPEATARPAGPKGVKEIMSGLRHRSPTFRLGALWDIWKTEECFPELVKEVERLLDDPDLHVRREATRTVALFGPLAAYLVPRLLEAVQAERDVWPQALESVARIGIDPKVILPEITRLLIRNPQASEDVARVLGLYPDLDLNEVIPALLTAFGREYSSEREMRELQRIVRSRVPDLEAVLRDHFAGDADLLRQLLWEVKQPHD